ncbi:MAG: hypothetical protein JWP43_3349 [Ramlibacter sp.]|nr:hypothetical protein [Ramlibacter sp.]
MKIHHAPHHWLAVALILAALLFTLSEAYGQSTGSAAVFEGRPAMAGAQGGLGAQAGPPQGGLGVQGSDAAQRTVGPRQQVTPQAFPQGTRDTAAGVDIPTAKAEAAAVRPDVRPARDRGVAKDQRSSARTVKRAAKRTVSRNRQGINPIDSTSNQGAQ